MGVKFTCGNEDRRVCGVGNKDVCDVGGGIKRGIKSANSVNVMIDVNLRRYRLIDYDGAQRWSKNLKNSEVGEQQGPRWKMAECIWNLFDNLRWWARVWVLPMEVTDHGWGAGDVGGGDHDAPDGVEDSADAGVDSGALELVSPHEDFVVEDVFTAVMELFQDPVQRDRPLMAWLAPVEGEDDIATEEIDGAQIPKSAVRWEKIWREVKRKLVAVHPALGLRLVIREESSEEGGSVGGRMVEDRVPWGVEGLGLYRNAGGLAV